MTRREKGGKVQHVLGDIDDDRPEQGQDHHLQPAYTYTGSGSSGSFYTVAGYWPNQPPLLEQDAARMRVAEIQLNAYVPPYGGTVCKFFPGDGSGSCAL